MWIHVNSWYIICIYIYIYIYIYILYIYYIYYIYYLVFVWLGWTGPNTRINLNKAFMFTWSKGWNSVKTSLIVWGFVLLKTRSHVTFWLKPGGDSSITFQPRPPLPGYGTCQGVVERNHRGCHSPSWPGPDLSRLKKREFQVRFGKGTWRIVRRENGETYSSGNRNVHMQSTAGKLRSNARGCVKHRRH